MGEALYNIDDTFGMACGRDAVGEQFQVPCRVETGRTAITKGTKVQLVGYTAKDHIFYVVATETGDSLPRASAMRTVANNTMERGSL